MRPKHDADTKSGDFLPIFPRDAINQDVTMSRQDANANFALTSFLDGANATYIDQLYARY